VAQSIETARLSAELPPLQRLAVAYAPAGSRPAWTALVLLDHRLGRAVAGASEPLIGQLKLAWWRDRMREPASRWPAGEPLLAALRRFDGERAALEALVDGWEGLIDDEAGDGALTHLGQARASVVAALARIVGCAIEPAALVALARRWTLAEQSPSSPIRLPRAMRPLIVLANQPDPAQVGPLALLRIVRLGMLGR
jgi:phytoene synthase